MFEEIVEQGGSVVQKTGQQFANLPSSFSQSAKAQLGIKNQTGVEDTTTKEFVKGLYAGTTDNSVKDVSSEQLQQIGNVKSVEDKQKMQELRLRLHQETYYEPTFNPQKKTEETKAEKNERVENEKKAKEMEELEKKQKDEEIPLAIQQAQKTEKNRGVSG